MSDLKPFINKVATGASLTKDEAEEAFTIMMSGQATPAQIGGFLMSLRVRGETLDEITGAVASMRKKMLRVDSVDGAVDIVGTGGDQSGSYNVSTATAFVVAGAGVPVGKHGNRALSSKSGAADALAALGVNIDATPEMIGRCLHRPITRLCVMWGLRASNSAHVQSSIYLGHFPILPALPTS